MHAAVEADRNRAALDCYAIRKASGGAMDFLLFRRADSALVVVPSLFQAPLASRASGLDPVAECDLDIDALNPRVALELGQHGFALLQGEEWAALELALRLSLASASERRGASGGAKDPSAHAASGAPLATAAASGSDAGPSPADGPDGPAGD